MSARIFLPPFCDPHAAEVVRVAGVPESGPWRATLVVAQIAMFQALAADPRIQVRCGPTPVGADVNNLTLVLAEIGCPGCWNADALHRVAIKLRDQGLSAVAQMTRSDPNWYAEERGR